MVTADQQFVRLQGDLYHTAITVKVLQSSAVQVSAVLQYSALQVSAVQCRALTVYTEGRDTRQCGSS